MRFPRVRNLVLSLVMALPLVALTSVPTAPPAAAAGYDCTSLGSQPWSLCISVEYNGQARAHLLFPIIPEPTDPYVWIQDCNSSGQSCGVTLGSVTQGRITPFVSTTPGRIYLACADFYDYGGYPQYVLGCSPAVAA